MDWEKFLQWLKDNKIEIKDEDSLKVVFEKIGKTYHDSKKDDLTTQITAELKKQFEKKPGSNTNDSDEDQTTILALQNEITELKNLLGDMKKNADASLEASKAKLAKDRETKIADLKKKGIDAGKLTEAAWTEKWKTIAEKDPEQFETILEGLAVDPTFEKEKNNGDGNNKDTGFRGPLEGADTGMVEAMNKMDN